MQLGEECWGKSSKCVFISGPTPTCGRGIGRFSVGFFFIFNLSSHRLKPTRRPVWLLTDVLQVLAPMFLAPSPITTHTHTLTEYWTWTVITST